MTDFESSQHTRNLSFSIDRILDKSSSIERMYQDADKYETISIPVMQGNGIKPFHLLDRCTDIPTMMEKCTDTIPTITEKLRTFYNSRPFYKSNNISTPWTKFSPPLPPDCDCSPTGGGGGGNTQDNIFQAPHAGSYKENMVFTINDTCKSYLYFSFRCFFLGYLGNYVLKLCPKL